MIPGQSDAKYFIYLYARMQINEKWKTVCHAKFIIFSNPTKFSFTNTFVQKTISKAVLHNLSQNLHPY